MELHFHKHHRTYVTNLNVALKSQSETVSAGNLVAQVELQPAIKFNAGGHINHTLFWENLAPPKSSVNPRSDAPNLHAALSKRWGDFATFKAAFETAALAIQGSGWIWLVKSADSSSNLDLVTTKDQDVVPKGKIPILGVDMWEHAYYLQYLNNKKEYVSGVWNVVNWRTAEKRFEGGKEMVFGKLHGLVSRM